MTACLPTLEEHIDLVLRAIRPERVFTSGPDGYDGHKDHIAVHAVAERAVARLRALGSSVTLYALDAAHTGALEVAGDVSRKKMAIALHASQRVVENLTQWGGCSLYAPLITDRETYNRLT